jgi:hypothetical protein
MAKPFDQSFKILAEEDPRGLMHLLGSLPLDVPAKVTAIERELTAPLFQVDHAYRIESGGKVWIEHYEAVTHFASDQLRRAAKYCASLGMKFECPVYTRLVLMAERLAPAKIPSRHTLDYGGARIEAEFRSLRLWELKASDVLRLERPALYPWVPLLKCTEREMREALERTIKTRNHTWAAQFGILGGLRYGRELWSNLEKDTAYVAFER